MICDGDGSVHGVTERAGASLMYGDDRLSQFNGAPCEISSDKHSIEQASVNLVGETGQHVLPQIGMLPRAKSPATPTAPLQSCLPHIVFDRRHLTEHLTRSMTLASLHSLTP